MISNGDADQVTAADLGQGSLTPEESAQLAEDLRRLGPDLIKSLSEEQQAEFREAMIRSRNDWIDKLSDEERAAFAEDWAQTMREKKAAERQRRTWQQNLALRLRSVYEVLTVPAAIYFLLSLRRVHPEYGLTWWRRIRLGLRMFANTKRITTGTSYKAHLAMAAKLFEMPPSMPGVVVECGCWQGGSTTNLSLICDIVGRELIVYDTFEGLPTAPANDKYAWPEAEGWYRGDLEVVQDHVRRYGSIDGCQFRKGLFEDTLPHHTEPVALAFLDVDYASSLHDCVLNLWPHLSEKGYLFIDEYTRLDYCALFFSEKWWNTYFDAPAPGLMGVGTGVGVGQFFLGPLHERPLAQGPDSVAFTRKDFYGVWDYDPEFPDEVEKARGH